ncbi:MAG TPA: hypothetical protein VK982_00680, partial [Bacteroidales bacterium]|nr:hypothetical protein [Bacteroidales bacterium]
MKKILFIFVIITIWGCSTKTSENHPENNYLRQITADTIDATNDFYDNAKTHELAIQPIKVEGEIENPGIVDFSKLPIRSVIVKETLLSEDGDLFVGAYRYDGYAIY